MSNLGKTIRIYLDDGNVSGIRHGEIINWTGQAVCSPRTKVAQLTNWEEVTKPGVYFLFGEDEQTERQAVYIGEAENVFERLKTHRTTKDFWNEVIIFTSKDENLTKSHVKYLEATLIQLAKEANRYSLQNGNDPNLPVLPRGDRASMEEFVLNLRVLLGALGHKLLEPLASKEAEKTSLKLFLKVKDIQATALLTDEGIVVLKDSLIVGKTKPSLSNGDQKRIQTMIQTGIIKENKSGSYTFTQDHLFSSPSQASAIILGRPDNGRSTWRTKTGKNLNQLDDLT